MSIPKSFNEINISTTTVIVSTNVEINLEWFFEVVKVTDFNEHKIKTNKEFQDLVIQSHPPIGTVTMAQFKDKLKGFKVSKKKKKYFRNALSLVVFVDKLITVKIPTKGKLQITGCIEPYHSQQCVQIIWDILRQYPPSPTTYTITGTQFTAYLHTVMTDKVFNFGFYINRQNLDRFINKFTEFNSLLETSFGYTGVNIKIPFTIDLEKTKVVRMDYEPSGWATQYITFKQYLDTLPPKDVQKELQKRRKNTFLVFHSGTAIMSGMSVDYMEDVYNSFVSTVIGAKNEIQEPNF